MMKIYIIACAFFLGLCCCEEAPSSYSVLPYENEVQPLPQYPHPNTFYTYYDGNDKKQKYTLGRIVKAPFKALKGAGNYMMEMFDGVRSKFLELNGSFLRAKGDLLKAGGENIIRHANRAFNKNSYAAQTYYSPYKSQSGPKYNPNPKPVNPYLASEEETVQNSIDDFGHEGGEYKDVALSHIEPAYNVDKESEDSFGFSRRKNELPAESGRKFKNFNPSERDYSLQELKREREIPVQRFDSRRPYPLNKHRRREFEQQRTDISYPESQRTQRSYHVVGGGYDFGKAIPVPVPIAINPAQLVFPSVQELDPVLGY